jgi:hypothetical protein
MKKIIGAIFSVLTAFTISGAFADQSPETIVGCIHNGWGVAAFTAPAAINAELCTPASGNKCAPCISSLENQGCKVIDVDYQTFPCREELNDQLWAFYLLSCDRR